MNSVERSRVDDRALHAAAFDLSPMAMLCVDEGGELIMNNAVAEALPFEELATSPLCGARQAPEIVTLRAHVRTYGYGSCTLRVELPTGMRTLAVDGRRSGTDCILFVRDETARERVETELGALRDLAVLGEVTAAVVHDLGNLLTPIVALIDALGRDAPEGTRSGTLVNQLREVAREGLSIWRQHLALLRGQHVDERGIDVARTVVDLQPILELLVGEAISLELDLPDDLAFAAVDRVNLERILVNLVVNARDAMPRGGHVVVRARSVTLDDGDARALGCARAGRFVTLSIIDDGMGMNDDVQRRAFEPYFSTKPHGRGAGLGLANARRFAVRAGGAIALRSVPAHGTTVTLHLPCTDGRHST